MGNTNTIPLGYDSDSNFYITLSEQKGIPFTSATGDHYLFNNAGAKAMVTDLKTNMTKATLSPRSHFGQ
jgi:hypothetical protein